MDKNMPAIYPVLMEFEGGNDDDPSDHGGRTSRGVTQHGDWDPYRRAHPGPPPLPADVWRAPDSAIRDIYVNGKYWRGMRLGEVQTGPDATIFDYNVNSGEGRGGRVVRHICGLSTSTYHIDDEALAAINKRDPIALIDAINAERKNFLSALANRPSQAKYRNGWLRRVRELTIFSKHLVALERTHPESPKPAPPPITRPTADETTGKAVPAPPNHTGTVTVGGGITGFFSAVGQWVTDNPVVTIVLVVVGLLVIYRAVKIAREEHFHFAFMPTPGTPVLPEKAVQP